MIKYRTQFEKIEAKEVLRETEEQVVLPPIHPSGKEKRENKVSDWRNWHDTWEAAHAFLISVEEARIESLRFQLERANERLGQIKGMTYNAVLSGSGTLSG